MMTTIFSFASLMMVGMSFVLPKLMKSTEENQVSEFAKFVLSLALNESASVMAFILGYIFHETKFAMVLFAISLLGFVMKFPKESTATDLQDKKSVNRKLDAE